MLTSALSSTHASMASSSHPFVDVASGLDRWLEDESARIAAENPDRLQCTLFYKPFAKQRLFHAAPDKVPPLRRRRRTGQIESAADGSDSAGQRARRREHAAAAPHVSRARANAAALFSPRCSARALREFQRHRSTSSPGATDRPRDSATARRKMTCTNIKARNFFSSASTSSPSSRCASGNFLPAAIAVPCRRTFPCMAAATNPGNIGHAWVKALWIERQAPPGMDNPESYDRFRLRFHSRARR